jgi:hypothetical protein
MGQSGGRWLKDKGLPTYHPHDFHESMQGASIMPTWNLFCELLVLSRPEGSSTGSPEMQQHQDITWVSSWRKQSKGEEVWSCWAAPVGLVCSRTAVADHRSNEDFIRPLSKFLVGLLTYAEHLSKPAV